MKMIYLAEVLKLTTNKETIKNYQPGQYLNRYGKDERISEYDMDCEEDALSELEDEYSSYLWDEEDMELEILERGLLYCDCSDDGSVISVYNTIMSRIEENELDKAKAYLNEVEDERD